MLVYIDFDDSFSHNIIQYLSEISCELKVINYKSLNTKHLLFTPKALILGPGPGHIEEYQDFVTKIKTWLDNINIKKVGICLGHQILLNYFLGLRIVRSKKIMHGSSMKIDSWQFKNTFSSLIDFKDQEDLNLYVQRYNSLVVDSQSVKVGDKRFIFEHNNEICAFFDPNIALTMQFHPESIGTNCPNLMFHEVIKKFVYS